MSTVVARRHRVHPAIVATIATVGIVLRLAVLVFDSPEQHQFSDMSGYIANATRIANGVHTHELFFQGIGYPFLLAALGVGQGVWTWLNLFHFSASVATFLLAWRCAAILAGERAALFAASLIALDVPLFGFAAYAMPETAYACCVVTALWLWLRHEQDGRARWLIGLGATIAVGYVLKGTLAIIVLPLAAYVLLACQKRVRAGLCLAASAGVVLVPLALLVHDFYGVYQLGSDNAGFNFMEGKCPSKRNLSGGAEWMSPLFAQLGETTSKRWDVPFEDSSFYFRAGLSCIKDEPIEIVRSLRYVYYLFFDNEAWPVNSGDLATASRVASIVWRVVAFPGMVFGLVAIALRRGWRERLIWLSFALTPCVVVYVFKSELRFRVPFDAVFLALSSYGWKTFMAYLSNGLHAERAQTAAASEGFRRWRARGRTPRALRSTRSASAPPPTSSPRMTRAA